MSASPEILVVDDDPRLRSLLQRFLSENDMVVATASDAAQARELLGNLTFDAIVLDIMMPGEDGLSLTDHIRATIGTPVLLLSAKGETEDRINGLAVGADDYLTKPFEPRELVLRLQSILRRASEQAPTTTNPLGARKLVQDDLCFDLEKQLLTKDGALVPLNNFETHLLSALAQQPGTALSRQALADSFDSSLSDRAIDVQITRLRKRIEPDAKHPRFLQTVRGVGYKLVGSIE